MFVNGSPESVGISSARVKRFIQTLEDYHLCTHSLLMARGDTVFAECYYAPFHREYKHRMYSVSKSFVAVAVGLLVEDGRLSLQDRLVDFFPEYENDLHNDFLREATVRDMLTMCTSMTDNVNWFYSGTKDRTEVYFRRAADRNPGTIWRYDSPGSYMLGVIVEKLTGKPFLEFMKERFLLDIGFSPDSYCLQVPGGHSFGDSGVMCTARDLLCFARFVMNGGTWEGRRYMDEAFLREATARQVDNSDRGFVSYEDYGYGYQIWKAPRDGFAFIGMGDQFAICDPKTDFIFILQSDNQGNGSSRPILYHTLYRDIVERLGDPLPEDPAAREDLQSFCAGRKLYAFPCGEEKGCAAGIDGRTYRLEENPMGIRWLRFGFAEDMGTLTYRNAQGEKTLRFGFGHNEFQLFPQEGYADRMATVPVPGHRYQCAVSAAWTEPCKLHIKVQIIDVYFGVLDMVFGFKGDRLSLRMEKTAEAFLDEYSGLANGTAVAPENT